MEINTVDAANDPSFIFSVDLLNASLSAADQLSANLTHFMSIRRGHLDVFISKIIPGVEVAKAEICHNFNSPNPPLLLNFQISPGISVRF